MPDLKAQDVTSWSSHGLDGCCYSIAQSCQLCNPMDCSTPGYLIIHHLPELAQIHIHWISVSVIPFSSCLQSFPALGSFLKSWLFASGGQNIGASASPISPSNEYSGLISFRFDWFDLLAVQGTLKSLLQHRSSRASVLQCSAFFVVQLSYPYMTSEKTIALTRQTFVGKVMPLFLNMLSRLVIAFLARSERLLILWLQSPSAVTFEPKKIKSVTVSVVSLSIYHEVMGLDAKIFIFWMLF